MKAVSLFVFLCAFCSATYSQQEKAEGDDTRKTYFSEQIYRYYADFKEKSNRAFKLGNRKDAGFYYNELIDEHLIGSFMDNFYADCFSTNQCQIQDFKKPLILLTYASWSIPTKGEVPALNAIAKKYKDQIDFAVIFWDQKKDAKQAAKAYNKHIDILYVDELQNRDAHTVKMLKHTLGFPTIFVVASNKKIVEIKRNPQNNWDLDDELALKKCLSEFRELVENVQDFEDNYYADSLE